MTTVLLVVFTVALFRTARRLRRGDQISTRGRKLRGVAVVAALIGMQAMIGTPALAAGCGEPPNPEVPGAGMVGALDPPTEGKGTKGSAYDQYGYAGMVWNVYDDNCLLSKSITDPNATIDSWVGNELFNVGKNTIGAVNSLHYTLMGGDLLQPLDDGIAAATRTLYEGPYTKWLWLPILLLGAYLFRHIWNGDFARISKRSMWALVGLGVAAAAYATPLFYVHLLDDVLIKGTSQIQAGFLPSLNMDQRNELPTSLHNEVVYRNWARGEFGSPDNQQAKEFGPALLNAQAWTKAEAANPDPNSINAKKQAYKDISTKLGPATGYFKGTDGSRTGDGVLAMFQGLAYGLFQLFAKAAILLGQVLMRIVVLAAPIIGFVAILYHDMLRKVGQAVGAVLLSVVLLAGLAGLHSLLLTMIFKPENQFALLTQVMLATLATVILMALGRPMRRMRQMVELSVGAAGAGVPSAGPTLFSRFRKGSDAPTPQDSFWATVKGSDPDLLDEGGEPAGTGQRRGRRFRPEASNPVAATAERLDRAPGGAAEWNALHSTGERSSGMLTARASTVEGATELSAAQRRALPAAGHSRVVDSPAVVDRGWDRGEDAVVVPSRVHAPDEVPGPRRAESEVVAGRPVFVLYRPSRGLEVDTGHTNANRPESRRS